MKKAKQFLQEKSKQLSSDFNDVPLWVIESMKDYARAAIKADRENVAKHAKWKSVPPRMTNMDGVEIDKDSIINAPEIQLT